MANNTTSSKTASHDLEAEIAALREDIASITGTIASLAKDKKNALKSEAERVTRTAVAKGEEAVENVQDNLSNIETDIKASIREKPIQSVLIAAGVGYILSKIF